MSDDLIERLREHATDWDGRQMPDGEPAKGDPTAGLMRTVADELARLRAEVERLLAALADERRHADALAEAVEAMDLCNRLDCEMRDNVLREHRARRQG